MAKKYDNGRYILIDRETGEQISVQSNLVEFEMGDSYRTEAQNDYRMTHATNFKKGFGFVKMYQDAVRKLTERFDKNEKVISTVTKLIPYIHYDHTLRCGRKFATISSLAKCLNEDRGNFNRLFHVLIDNGIVAGLPVGKIYGDPEDTKTIYIANPYIYYMGTDPLQLVVDMFKDSNW